MSDTIDARGLNCPQPVILTRKRLMQEDAAGAITVLVDTEVQAHNCTRAAEKLGWAVTRTEKGDGFELTLRR